VPYLFPITLGTLFQARHGMPPSRVYGLGEN
jgi:hypothetical protein